VGPKVLAGQWKTWLKIHGFFTMRAASFSGLLQRIVLGSMKPPLNNSTNSLELAVNKKPAPIRNGPALILFSGFVGCLPRRD
jgi:hypothetical protein